MNIYVILYFIVHLKHFVPDSFLLINEICMSFVSKLNLGH